jgi:hypothetical protein
MCAVVAVQSVKRSDPHKSLPVFTDTIYDTIAQTIFFGNLMKDVLAMEPGRKNNKQDEQDAGGAHDLKIRKQITPLPVAGLA